MKKLSPKHRAFVAAYFRLNMNGTRAYASVYGTTDDKVSQVNASRLLSNAMVSAYVDECLRKMAMTGEEVIARLSAHARGNIDDFIGSMDRVDLDQARTRGAMHLAKKIKQHTTRISKSDGEDIEYHDIEIELYDAQAATVQLGKILGLFVERVEVRDWRERARALGHDPDALVTQFKQMIIEGRKTATDGHSSSAA